MIALLIALAAATPFADTIRACRVEATDCTLNADSADELLAYAFEEWNTRGSVEASALADLKLLAPSHFERLPAHLQRAASTPDDWARRAAGEDFPLPATATLQERLPPPVYNHPVQIEQLDCAVRMEVSPAGLVQSVSPVRCSPFLLTETVLWARGLTYEPQAEASSFTMTVRYKSSGAVPESDQFIGFLSRISVLDTQECAIGADLFSHKGKVQTASLASSDVLQCLALPMGVARFPKRIVEDTECTLVLSVDRTAQATVVGESECPKSVRKTALDLVQHWAWVEPIDPSTDVAITFRFHVPDSTKPTETSR